MSCTSSLRLGLLSLLVVAAGSFLAWCLLGRPGTGIDDADIFFVYARHFAEGHGFVYNIGGERVEGFTSMLWTLVCSAFFSFTRQVEIPLYLLNLFLGALTVWVCLRRAGNRMLFLLVFASVPAWFAWCQLTLMESGLWCFLLTMLVLAVVDGQSIGVVLWLPLFLLTRPESMLWGLWLILMYGLRKAASEGWRKALSAMILPSAAYAATLLLLIGFRLEYFGYPVPNTYYAKVSSNLLMNLLRGSGYLLLYLLSNPVVLLVAAVWVRIIMRGISKRDLKTDPIQRFALCLIPGFFIPVLVGGDHFGGFRFYQSIWPLLCLLAAQELPAIFARHPGWNMRVVALLLLAVGWLLFPFTGWMRHEFAIAESGRETGRALTQMFRDQKEWPTVATITAGGRKYTYPGKVYDLMGLNSTDMAHASGLRTGFKNHTAFNRDIFYTWMPDIVLCGQDADFDARVLKGLLSSERFSALYQKISLRRNGQEITAYYLHDLLAELHDAD